MVQRQRTLTLSTLLVAVLLVFITVPIQAQSLSDADAAQTQTQYGQGDNTSEPYDEVDAEAGAAALAEHMVALEEAAAANQDAILELQVAELARLESDPPDGSDEAGEDAREEFAMLTAKQSQIDSQLDSLEDKLNAIPSSAQPQDLMAQLDDLKGIREERGPGIKQGFNDIKGFLSDEDAAEIPVDEHGGLDDSNESDDGEPASDGGEAPETIKEATAIISGGQIKTPAHLIEIFERIPAEETPTGNLDYFTQQQM